jgi:hypothetical protein
MGVMGIERSDRGAPSRAAVERLGLFAFLVTLGCSGGSASVGNATNGGGASGSGKIFLHPQPVFPPPGDEACSISVAAKASLCDGRTGCPIILDAQIGSPPTLQGWPLAVAAGADASYAGFRMSGSGTRPAPSICVFTLRPGGASQAEIDPFPLPADLDNRNYFSMAADAADAPHVFVSARSQVADFSRREGRWQAEPITVPGLIDLDVHDAAFAGDTVRVLFAAHPEMIGSSIKFRSLHLASRGPTGGWTQELIFDAAGKTDVTSLSRLALGANGSAHGVFLTRDPEWDVYAWRQGAAPAVVLKDFVDLQGAAVRGGGAGIAPPLMVSHRREAIELQIPGASGYRALPLPGTSMDLLGPCTMSMGGGTGCGPQAKELCHVGPGFASRAVALERTDDGAVWLAYVDRGADIDLRVRNDCGAMSCFCSVETLADRSTPELVLARISDAPDARDVQVRLRTRVPATGKHSKDFMLVRMAARGTRLVIAVGGDLEIPLIYRYLIVETALLK